MAGEVPEAIRRYFDGLNNENWDDFNGIWTEDAELIGVGARPRSGKEDVLTYYSTVLVPYPVHYDDPYAIHVAGDIVTVEIHFTGETHEGVPVEFEAVDVFTMRDGMICRLTTWYDIDAVRKAATRPGAPAARLKTLVRHAAKRSPFYRDRLAAAGVGPEDVAADITTEEGRAAALAACPKPDILVTNAGGPPPGDFRKHSREDWNKALNANMLTPIELIKATLDGMIERKFGRIVNKIGRAHV